MALGSEVRVRALRVVWALCQVCLKASLHLLLSSCDPAAPDVCSICSQEKTQLLLTWLWCSTSSQRPLLIASALSLHQTLYQAPAELL
jgi:hypothetical protein